MEGVRVNPKLPVAVHRTLEKWAQSQGRSVSSLANFLLERAIWQAVSSGECPFPISPLDTSDEQGIEHPSD